MSTVINKLNNDLNYYRMQETSLKDELKTVQEKIDTLKNDKENILNFLKNVTKVLINEGLITKGEVSSLCTINDFSIATDSIVLFDMVNDYIFPTVLSLEVMDFYCESYNYLFYDVTNDVKKHFYIS